VAGFFVRVRGARGKTKQGGKDTRNSPLSLFAPWPPEPERKTRTSATKIRLDFNCRLLIFGGYFRVSFKLEGGVLSRGVFEVGFRL